MHDFAFNRIKFLPAVLAQRHFISLTFCIHPSTQLRVQVLIMREVGKRREAVPCRLSTRPAAIKFCLQLEPNLIQVVLITLKLDRELKFDKHIDLIADLQATLLSNRIQNKSRRLLSQSTSVKWNEQDNGCDNCKPAVPTSGMQRLSCKWIETQFRQASHPRYITWILFGYSDREEAKKKNQLGEP